MFSPLFVMLCTRSGLRRSSLRCHRSVVKVPIGPSTKTLDCQQQWQCQTTMSAILLAGLTFPIQKVCLLNTLFRKNLLAYFFIDYMEIIKCVHQWQQDIIHMLIIYSKLLRINNFVSLWIVIHVLVGNCCFALLVFFSIIDTYQEHSLLCNVSLLCLSGKLTTKKFVVL